MLHRIVLLILCFVSIFSHTSFSQSLDPAKERRIDSLFLAYDTSVSPGCSVAIYNDGRIVYAKGHGMADLEHNIKITPQTVFDIGSTSKQFTAACIVLLAQQKKLTFDDD